MQKSQTNNFEIFDASEYKVGLVVAQFNSDITNQILVSALEKLEEFNVKEENITVEHVAGSVEIPVILQTLGKTKKYNCLIAIGAIIKGQTDHYDYVAKLVCEGTLMAMMDNNIPIGLAVLTTHNKKLAEERVNIGGEAIEAAMKNAKIIKKYS